MKYTFLEERLEGLYQSEELLGRLILIFSGLAIFVACLGLIGIASFTAEQRTKEIGIRKVLGASTGGLTIMLLRDSIKWVVLSNLVAWPSAYLIVSRWLENYAYRIPLSADIFVSASLGALSLAVLTVGFQSMRAGLANPVHSLRYE